MARNGKSFEQRILSSAEGQSNKFNFMRPGDPYNAYYEHRIRQFEEGKGEEAAPEKKKAKVDEAPAAASDGDKAEAGKAPGVVATSAAATTTVGKASVLGPIARAQRNKPSGPPPAEEFYMTHPEGLSALDVEVIKLTAQYTAASGRQFLAALAQKEQRNPLFDFLKPSHLLFSYFTTLVDAYIKVLQPTDAQREAVKAGRDGPTVLARAVHRWEYDKEEEARAKQAQAEAEAERVAYQAVDWHEFVVVETITFAEDELLDVGMPGQEEEEEEEAEAPEEDMDIDMDLEEPVPAAPAVPPPPPPRPGAAAMAGGGAKEGGEEGREEEEEEEIRVVSGYAPRAVGGETLQPAMMLDPVTGKQVPVSEVGEHMRIQFIDPRYREEQKRALEKKKATALAAGADIAANVANFAKKRTDIFGTAEDQERAIYEEQERFRQRQEENQRVIWDGSVASASAAQLSAAISAAQQVRVGGGPAAPSGPTIGPSVPTAPMSRGPPGPPPGAPPAGAQMGMGMGMGTLGGGGMMMTNSLAPSQPMPPGPPPGPPPRGPPPRGPPPPPPRAAPIQLQEEDMGDDSAGAGGGGGGGGVSGLLSESEFAAKHPGAVTLQLQCPVDESNAAWGLQGQTLSLPVGSVMRSVKELKEQLSPLLGGMPLNKMQIKSPLHGFLKDGQSLASYNVGAPDSSFLELRTRSRGGR